MLVPWVGWGLLYLVACLGLGALVLSRGGALAPVTDGAFDLRRITHPLSDARLDHRAQSVLSAGR